MVVIKGTESENITKRNVSTFIVIWFHLQGGLATKNEMCVSFVYYYPAHNIYNCLSLPPLYQSIQVVEGLEIEWVVLDCYHQAIRKHAKIKSIYQSEM